MLLLTVFQLQGQVRIRAADPAPPQGYVSDASTAVAIAEAVWRPLYGPSVSRRKPYRAFLRDSAVWVVYGTGAAGTEEFPTIEINKQDGRILKTSGKSVMQEHAKHDTLTVFVRIPDAQHEQYIIQHGRRIALTTQKGESFIGSFKVPIDPEARPGSSMNILGA